MFSLQHHGRKHFFQQSAVPETFLSQSHMPPYQWVEKEAFLTECSDSPPCGNNCMEPQLLCNCRHHVILKSFLKWYRDPKVGHWKCTDLHGALLQEANIMGFHKWTCHTTHSSPISSSQMMPDCILLANREGSHKLYYYVSFSQEVTWGLSEKCASRMSRYGCPSNPDNKSQSQ